jgi:hypothetical protein
MTDTVAGWIKQGFVCGPFDTPPLPENNCHPMPPAIVTQEKVYSVVETWVSTKTEQSFSHYSFLGLKNGLILKKDRKRAFFANKTTTLEMIGVILPFLLIPEKLTNQHIVVKDNIACIFGRYNRSVAGDTCTSIIISNLHLIPACLGRVLHFEHLPVF